MSTKSDNRYAMRQEEDGTWTVFDAMPVSAREDRMMVGLTEARAKAYADRLNARPPYTGRGEKSTQQEV